MCWCNPNIRTPVCDNPECVPPYFKQKIVVLKETPVVSPKDQMKELYQKQASQITQVIVNTMCDSFAEVLNGKQMLQVQQILKEGVKIDSILDMIVDFVVEDAKLTDKDISFVVDYMKTDVAQRVINAGVNLQAHFLENKEKFADMIITPEVMVKIEKII